MTFSGVLHSPLDEGTAISNTATISAASEGGSGALPLTGSLSVDATPNLSVAFVDDDSDNVVTPGQTVHYTLTISNSGDGSATTSASVTIPSGMGTPTNITFDHCTSSSNSYSGQTLTLSNLIISTSNDCVVDFDVPVSSPSTENLNLTASADVATASQGGNNPATVDADTLTVDVTPQLAATLSDDDSDNIVSLGQTVNMTITIANTGDGTATGVSAAYSGSAPATNLGTIQYTHCGSSYSSNNTNRTISVTGLEIAVGTNCIITFSYDVPTDANDGAHITNTVDASGATEGGNNPSLVVGDTLTVDASNTAPDIPTDVSSAVFGSHDWFKTSSLTGATLNSSLSDPNSSDQVRYRVQISLDSGFFTDTAIEYLSTLGAQGAHTYTYQESGGTYVVGSASTSLSDGAYYMRIRAEDENGATSGWYTIPGTAFNYDTTAPVTPTAPYLISKDVGKATIGWATTTDANPHLLIPYRIEDSDSSDFSTFSDSDTYDLSQLFTGLKTNAHHYFRIYWRDAAGNLSDASSVLDVFIPAATSTPPSSSESSGSSSNKTQRSASSTPQTSTQNENPTDKPKTSEQQPSSTSSGDTTKVTIFVKDSNNQPIKAAMVTLHSEPRVGYTDEEGQVTFYGVPIGEHTATVEYKGMTVTTPVTLKKGVEELSVTLVMKNINQKHHWCWLWWLLLLVVIYLLWRYYRNRKKNSQAKQQIK